MELQTHCSQIQMRDLYVMQYLQKKERTVDLFWESHTVEESPSYTLV